MLVHIYSGLTIRKISRMGKGALPYLLASNKFHKYLHICSYLCMMSRWCFNHWKNIFLKYNLQMINRDVFVALSPCENTKISYSPSAVVFDCINFLGISFVLELLLPQLSVFCWVYLNLSAGVFCYLFFSFIQSLCLFLLQGFILLKACLKNRKCCSTNVQCDAR